MKINQATTAPTLEADLAVQTTLMPGTAPFRRCRTAAGSWWYLGNLATPLVTGADNGGAFALLDLCLQRGTEPPAHVHQREDETFYVLDGHLSFTVDDAVLHAGPGDTVHLPRGRRHRYQLETEYARVLLHIAPAGFEHFFRQLSEPAQSLTVPPPPANPDPAHLTALAATFGVTFG
ncbi:quercetin 2,3-dioxygenase [Hymenobacter sp. B81]|uniref:quercetin 2,3-dioxygenase n=1 Tax=Hymenobacter sp. B81 TaxID=3344878 RepID=UPI0037DC4D9F